MTTSISVAFKEKLWQISSMKSYGQFCSLAKALEIIGERWTPLVLRELLCGSSRFSEIQRGVPRMSPALLSKRLNDLELSGVITRGRNSGCYSLTEAGLELKPVIEELAVWGRRWVGSQLGAEDYDPDLLMWDMRRRIDLQKLPRGRICLKFEFIDVDKDKRDYWLVADNQDLELCITDPGYPVDLYITTSIKTMTHVWNGDLPLQRMIEDARIELHGPTALCKAFPGWLMLNRFAGVTRASPQSQKKKID